MLSNKISVGTIPAVFSRRNPLRLLVAIIGAVSWVLAGRWFAVYDRLDSAEALVIVRDARVPLTASAKKAQQYLDELEQQLAVVLFPSVEVLAGLDAFRELLSDAKSGDLDWRGNVVSPQAVEDWMQSKLGDGLRDLVSEFLGKRPGNVDSKFWDAHEVESLNTFLTGRPTAPLQEVAETLQRSVEDVAATIRRHPDQFGLLGGSPAVVYRTIGIAEAK